MKNKQISLSPLSFEVALSKTMQVKLPKKKKPPKKNGSKKK